MNTIPIAVHSTKALAIQQQKQTADKSETKPNPITSPPKGGKTHKQLKATDAIETLFIPLSLKSTRVDLTSSLYKSNMKWQCKY